MKLLSLVLASALTFTAGQAIANDDDRAGAGLLGGSGQVNAETITAGVVGVAVAAAIISNSRGTDVTGPIQCPPGQVLENGQCVPEVVECPDGEELVNGVCEPITTVTETVTSTGTATATVTVTGN